MSCTPCPPCDFEEPLTCEPYGVITTGNRVMVEDDAFCTKTLETPAAKSTLVWNDGVKWELAPSPIEFVQKAGDTMTGLLVLSGDPTANLGAVTKQLLDSEITSTKQYVDTNTDNKVLKSGDTMTGGLVVNSTILANGSSSKIGYDTGAGGQTTQGSGSKSNLR